MDSWSWFLEEAAGLLVVRVPEPRYLAQLPIAWIPELLVVRVPKPRYLSAAANSLDSRIARRQDT